MGFCANWTGCREAKSTASSPHNHPISFQCGSIASALGWLWLHTWSLLGSPPPTHKLDQIRIPLPCLMFSGFFQLSGSFYYGSFWGFISRGGKCDCSCLTSQFYLSLIQDIPVGEKGLDFPSLSSWERTSPTAYLPSAYCAFALPY